MSRPRLLILVLATAALIAGLYLSLRQSPAPSPATSESVQEQSSLAAPKPGPAASRFPGESILRNYASPSASPDHDLTLMAQLMDNFLLLVKSAADRPLSANEDWAAALRGRNPAHEAFLPEHHVALNAKGQLIDRWGTPLFFHVLARGAVQIRSAGPDRILFTADDLQRNPDGSFQHGPGLDPPASLGLALNHNP